MRIWFVGKKTGIALGAIVILFFALILFGHINKNSAAILIRRRTRGYESFIKTSAYDSNINRQNES